MNWNASKLLPRGHSLKNIPAHHGKASLHTQWANTFVTSEWKGECGKGLCNAQRKVTPSPPHWGPPFAWSICSFNFLVWPCECYYTVYWSTCFTYFVILESSTRTSLLLYSPFLSLSLFPLLLPFTKCFKYLLSALPRTPNLCVEFGHQSAVANPWDICPLVTSESLSYRVSVVFWKYFC